MNTVRWITAAAAFALVVGSGSRVVAAQAEGPGPGMPPPPDRGFEGRGAMPRRMPHPPITAATIPVSAMKGYLNLTDAQHGKIADITDDLRDELRPTPPMGGPGRPGGPDEDGRASQRQRPEPPASPDGETQRTHVDAAIKKASAAIESVLTDDQKKRLPTLLQALTALQADRITLEAVSKLKLTDDQMTKLAALGKTATTRKVDRILTDEQLDVAERYRAPGGGPGGPGGRNAGGPPQRGGSPEGQQGFGRPQGGPPNGGPPGGRPNGGPPDGGYPFGGPPNGGASNDGPSPDGAGPPPGGSNEAPQK